MQLKYISAQPAIPYYAWQVEVYINNFLQNGIDPSDIHVVLGYEEEIGDEWEKLANHFEDVKFFFYKDTMQSEYQPAIQAHLLEKHFSKNEWLSDDAVFFHDSDFCFTKPFDFAPFLLDDKWHFSDTISYVGADYIKSKDERILDVMCDIVGIEKELVENNQKHSGGAQKLMKGLTPEYWKEVYRCSVELFDTLSKLTHLKKEGDPYGIQAWTASMWAELWVAWKMEFEINIPKEFDFCWATCPAYRWEQLSFFHNAGVPNAKGDMFFKGGYIDKLPYKTNLKLNENKCSNLYYQMVKNTKTCLDG